MSDRITPYDEGGSVKDRIDEIVQLDAKVHIEMMDEESAWMRIGNEVFWIRADNGKLIIRHDETR